MWLKFIMASIQLNKHQQFMKIIQDEIPPSWNKYLCAKRENLDKCFANINIDGGFKYIERRCVLFKQMILLYPSASETPEYMSINISTNTSVSAAVRLAEDRDSHERSVVGSTRLFLGVQWINHVVWTLYFNNRKYVRFL